MKKPELTELLSNLPPATRVKLTELITNKKSNEAINNFTPENILFDKQIDVLNSTSKKKVVVCSRRSGKTYLIAFYLLYYALHNPKTTSLYIGLTKDSARKVIWDTIVNLIDDYNLPCKYDNHTLNVTFTNKSRIFIEGAKDAAAIERFRGLALSLAVIDEAQSFSTMFAASMVSDILVPALGDYNGTLLLAGTPDPLCKSVLYLAWTGESPFKNYEKFHWNVTHNKKFPRFVNNTSTPEQYLNDIMAETGYTSSDPGFKREYLGLFVESKDELVYGFDPERDLINELPKGYNWNYIISCDIGFCDSDAIVVGCYSTDHPIAYIVESYSKPRQDITSFMEQIKEFDEKYKPIKIVMDPAGGGRKVIEEFNNRYGVYIEPAQKYNPKVIGCSMVASEFRKQKLKVLDTIENDILITQLSNITYKTKKDRQGNIIRYVPDGKEVTAGGTVIGDDCADAMLYFFKYLQNYYYAENDENLYKDDHALQIAEHKRRLIDDYYYRLSLEEEEEDYKERFWYL